MPTPGEHKTVQNRILEYHEAIGWASLSREESEQRRGFDSEIATANHSIFVVDLLDVKVQKLKPGNSMPKGRCSGSFNIFKVTSTEIGSLASTCATGRSSLKNRGRSITTYIMTYSGDRLQSLELGIRH